MSLRQHADHGDGHRAIQPLHAGAGKRLSLTDMASRAVVHTFRSLRHRNFRIYCTGQIISLCGTWMQNLALSWLVYKLTKSSFALGMVSFANLLPTLLFGLAGGWAADLMDRRRILLVTQALALLQAGTLAWLSVSGHIALWQIVLLAALLGSINAFDIPARQALVVNMVSRANLVNAVSINSSIFNGSRAIGPAIAAIVVSWVGEGFCFLINALSYLATLLALSLLKFPRAKPACGRDQSCCSVKEALVFAAANTMVRNVLLLTATLSLFGMQYLMLLPVFASDILHAHVGALGWLTSGTGFGAFVAAMILANRGSGEMLKRGVGFALAGFSLTLIAFCFSSHLALSVPLSFLLGAFMTLQLSGGHSLLQLHTPDHLRGRMMSIYMMLMMGVAPLGNLSVGLASQMWGAPWVLTACACFSLFVASAYLLLPLNPAHCRSEQL